MSDSQKPVGTGCNKQMMINPAHIAHMIRVINTGPYFKLLSMPVSSLGIGRAEVVFEIADKHLNPFGFVHGGVYASAIDTAAYWSVYCELEADAGYVTVDLHVENLGPANAGRFRAKGRRLTIGKTFCLAEAVIVDETDRMVAHGTSKMMVTTGKQTIDEAVARTGGGPLPPKFIPVD